jgi:hypothetical protein
MLWRTSIENSNWSLKVQTLKTLAVKAWYLLLGAVLAALVVENIVLRQRIEVANATVQHAVGIAEKSTYTSAECLSTLTDVRDRLRPALEEVNGVAPFPTQDPPVRNRTASVVLSSP